MSLNNVILFPMKSDIVTVCSGMFFNQWEVRCVCLSPKSPHLRLLSLLTVCLWMRSNTCHMSWKIKVQLFLEVCIMVLLCNSLHLVIVVIDSKLMQDFPSLCWNQHRPPTRRCIALIVSGGELRLKYSHQSSQPSHVEQTYLYRDVIGHRLWTCHSQSR